MIFCPYYANILFYLTHLCIFFEENISIFDFEFLLMIPKLFFSFILIEYKYKFILLVKTKFRVKNVKKLEQRKHP